MHSFSSLYNENTVISKEYPGPLDFDITGNDCRNNSGKFKNTKYFMKCKFREKNKNKNN